MFPVLLGRSQATRCEVDKHEVSPAVQLSIPRLDLQAVSISEKSCENDHARGLGLLARLLQGLWMPIIRPPRSILAKRQLHRGRLYVVATLEHHWFYERRDLQLQNSRGHRLECSHYIPCERDEKRRPCVVYLHGASSNRFEVQSVLPYLFQYDVSVFCFDFSGSGNSEGEYVSLGSNEEQDLRVVLDYLRRSGLVSSIGLWGWSMGAVTAILRASQDPSLSACILDSPFADFGVLASELVKEHVPLLPRMLEGVAFQLACDEARARTGCNLADLKPRESAAQASIPAFFGAGAHDKLIMPHHTQDVYSHWAGVKEIHIFDGEHSSTRPSWFLAKAAEFLWDNFWTEAIDKQRRIGSVFVTPARAQESTLQRIREGMHVVVSSQTDLDMNCQKRELSSIFEGLEQCASQQMSCPHSVDV